MYREEAVKIITQSLRCCMSDDNVVASTRKAMLLLAGHFSFSGDLLGEDWMLKQAGFVDASRASSINSDAVVQVRQASSQYKEAHGHTDHFQEHFLKFLLPCICMCICATRTRKQSETRPGRGTRRRRSSAAAGSGGRSSRRYPGAWAPPTPTWWARA